jgi:hypothetical protein
MAEFAINNAWNQSIDKTPFMLNCGQTPDTPEVVALRSMNPAVNKFVGKWSEQLNRAKSKRSLWCRTYSGPSKVGSRLTCPELCMTMDRRPEYSPMPSITEMIQDPHAPEHRPYDMEYTLCDSTHRIFEYLVTTHAMFSSCTSPLHSEVPLGSYSK